MYNVVYEQLSALKDLLYKHVVANFIDSISTFIDNYKKKCYVINRT